LFQDQSGESDRIFFFCEKSSKRTLIHLGRGSFHQPDPNFQKFFGSFFQKRLFLLAFLMPPHPQTWLKPRPEGLFCEPGKFFIDPVRAVPNAVITHAHADHARPGHAHVLATAGTLAVMRTRMGAERAGGVQQEIAYREPIAINDVTVTLIPAGHVLGAAQIVMDYQGARAVVSGDYKRQPDPTCAPFEPVKCDVFVTEATFGLPVFHHPSARSEIQRLLDSQKMFPERTHVIGCYALGKCQRLIAELRAASYDAPIYLHGAHMPVCETYQRLGVKLGELRPATVAAKAALRGAIVLAPPSAIADRWARRLEDPVVAMASGWMRIRQRAKAGGIELPLIISDHADWDDLLATIREVAPEIWVTHGAEEALIHAAGKMQIRARALRLVGYGDEDAA
jgi:putative mRNA 3-end processing factor